MGEIASQITSLPIVYLTVDSGADQRKYQGSASLTFATGEFPAQRASNAENFPFDDVITLFRREVSVMSRQYSRTVMVMFLSPLVYKRACSFICKQYYGKTHRRIFMKFSGYVGQEKGAIWKIWGGGNV